MARMFVLSLFVMAGLVLSPFTAQAADPVLVKKVGGYHVGGQEVVLQGLPIVEKTFTPGGPLRKVDPNGEFEVGQMYVQFIQLANPKGKYPLMFWHGGGLAGSTWENTPDGREGWQMFFLRKGHDVYVSDAVERGRASWARFPEINKSEPVFRTKQDAWSVFRFGDAYTDKAKRAPYAGLLFPVEAFDQFMKGSIPRWSTSNDWIKAAYSKYVSTFKDGCVIIAHSQAANFAFMTTLAHPDKVKALIIIEGSGAPKIDAAAFATIKHIPQLHVWGDYVEKSPLWQKYQSNVRAFADGAKKAGASVTWISLPEMGIKGNSHMVYVDKNSDQVAEIVQKWMNEQKLMK